MPSRWGEPHEALREVDGVLRHGPATDLVLLPEASLTGYVSPDLDFDLSRFAEPLDGATARALSALAREHAAYLFGPLILEEDGACFNATVGFSPGGEHVVTYRKRHPWIPERWATAGTEPHPLVEILGLRVTIACCYDVHFLAEAKGTLDAADLLLFPSAWVEETDSRPRRLKRIAQRHRLAVAAANWGRGLLSVPGQGNSFILDADGETLASIGTSAPTPTPRRADAIIERIAA